MFLLEIFIFMVSDIMVRDNNSEYLAKSIEVD